VGETWEGWVEPFERIAACPHRDRITVVNRYVDDREVDGWFGGADVVVLPYRRSSQSGVLHVAMAYGLPVVATDVGGLGEALEGYPSAVLTAPGDIDDLVAGIEKARHLERRAGAGPTWAQSAAAIHELCRSTIAGEGPDGHHR
jgi:glycosyltransferase involved in cell wall biosynthesis